MRFELTTFTLARQDRTVANLQEFAVYDAPDSTLHRRLHNATRCAGANGARGWCVSREFGDTAARADSIAPLARFDSVAARRNVWRS